jgi:hypothetical protein
MIHLTCTNCRAMLEIDDAFAGGVCRCQHCGTIQTVPAHMKGNASAATAAAQVQPQPQQQRPLYQKQRRPQDQATGRGGGTGLDELSDAVLSSGLARSGLRKDGGLLEAASVTGGIDYATPPQQKKSPAVWIVLAGVVAGLVLLGLLGYLFVAQSAVVVSTPSPVGGSGTATVGNGTVITGNDEEDVVIPKTPHFCGVDLTNATGVVYVLDRGSASGDLLDTLKAATYASLETLGPRRKFAIVFWEAGSEPPAAFPEKGLIDASPGNIAAATKAFEDVVAQGRSDPAAALDNAAARNPTDVVFVTAKGDDLGDDVVEHVGQLLAGKRVHAFAIGEDFGATLKAIAKQQNGTYQLLNKRQLDAFSRGR